MTLLAGKDDKIDAALLEEIGPKISGATFGAEDLEKGYTLFGQLCNNNDEIRYELAELSGTYQFNLGAEVFSVAFEAGGCNVFKGAASAPTVIFTIAPEVVLSIIMGDVHSSVAQMNGDIVYTGPRHDAIAYQRIFELFLDEFI